MTPVSEDESILDISSISTLIWILQKSYICHSSSVGTMLYPQGYERVEYADSETEGREEEGL